MRKLIVIIMFAPFGLFAKNDLQIVDAINKALENNFDIQLVKGNYEVTERQNSWGMAGMVPTFSLNVGNTAGLQDNTNNPASFFPGVIFSDNLQATLDMNWTIFSGFGIRINKERFDKLQQQTRGNAIVVIESTIYDVVLGYYTAVVQERKLEVLRSLLAYSKDKYEYFKMKGELGVSTNLDALEFENQLLTDSTNLILQELSVRNAQRNLNLMMGEDVELEYTLVDSLGFSSANYTYDELKVLMSSNNQNLKNQFINYELKDLEVAAKRAAFYPVVTLRLSTSPSVGYFELFGDMGFTSNTNALNHAATINIRYDIFQGMNRKRNRQIAEIQRDMSNIEIEQLKIQLSHQLRGSFELYQTRNKVRKMSLQRMQNARKLWLLGKEKYELGLINVFNLNDIKLAYEQSVLNYYDRLFELIQAHYDLMRITGNISQEYKVAEKFDQDY